MKASLNSSPNRSTKPPIKIDSRRTRGHLRLVPDATHEAVPNPVLPGRRYTKAEIRQHRAIVLGGIVSAIGAGALIAILATRPIGAAPESVPTRDEATICEVGPGTQEFYFANGDGKNAAILAIKGAGIGDNAPCGTEAKKIVTDAIMEASHGNNSEPQFDGKPIILPLEIHPVGTTPTHIDK